jgi:hypothetical protein
MANNQQRNETIFQHLQLAVMLMHEARNTDGDADSRALSIAITQVETGELWFANAISKVVEQTEDPGA